MAQKITEKGIIQNNQNITKPKDQIAMHTIYYFKSKTAL